MTFHQKSETVKGAALHLLDSAILKTKAEAGGENALEQVAKAFGEHVADVMAKLGATSDELKTMREKAATLTEQVSEIDQRTARGGGESFQRTKSVGEQFVNDERVKNWLESDPSKGGIDLQVKATLTSATTDAAGSVGDAIQVQRDREIVGLPRRRPRVRSLLTVSQTDSNAVEWAKITGRTEGAAPVAEGATKPESDIKFDLATTPTRVIAHWTKASKQVLSDIPQLKSLIDTELMDGLALKEEDQILNGDGTGQNLNGLIPQATAYSAPITPADLNQIDVIAIAALQAAEAFYEVDGAIISERDLWIMRLMKDTEGRYIIGNPAQSAGATTLWNIPLVATPAMTSRKFLVGAFKVAATLYDRWAARVETGFVNDDFIKNLVTILAEERLALAVKRPGAMIYGDFDTALAS